MAAKTRFAKWTGCLREGYTFVVDADLRSYFDTIGHARLMECIKERVSDGRVLELIEAYLHQDIVKDMEKWTPSGGTPQGAVISPLLANIYLHGLDGRWCRRAIGWCDTRMTLWCCAVVLKRPSGAGGGKSLGRGQWPES